MTVQEFIQKIGPIIKKESISRGYKICSPVIAQAIIEGRYGNSVLASKYHNHFGMKCGSNYKGPSVNMQTGEEYTPGVHTTINANFRTYKTDEDGIKGYYDFMQYPRYANLKNCDNSLSYITLLKRDGYATSSTYIRSLSTTIATYNLKSYDAKPVYKKPTANVVNDVISGKYGSGDDRRKKLESEGYIYSEVQQMVNKKLHK